MTANTDPKDSQAALQTEIEFLVECAKKGDATYAVANQLIAAFDKFIATHDTARDAQIRAALEAEKVLATRSTGDSNFNISAIPVEALDRVFTTPVVGRDGGLEEVGDGEQR